MREHFFEYKKQLEQAVYDLDPEPIMAAADILFEAWQNNKSVYICGNGGSWSTAEHFASDLREWSRIPGSGGVRAQALTLAPLATAYANDHDYDEIFSRQLSDLMQLGDVAVGISCSGRSMNVVNALHFALRFGKRIVITGQGGLYIPICRDTKLTRKEAAAMILINAPDIRVQEDMHLAVCHILAGEVRVRIAEVSKERTLA